MLNFKRICSVLLATTLVLTLSACGGKNAGNSTSAGTDATNFGAKFPDVDLSNGITVTEEKITLTCGFDLVEIAGTLTR